MNIDCNPSPRVEWFRPLCRLTRLWQVFWLLLYTLGAFVQRGFLRRNRGLAPIVPNFFLSVFGRHSQIKNYPYPRACLIFILAMLALAAQTGCMTVQGGSAVVENINTQQYSGKRIAALPVKTQTGLATDSILPLKQEINKRLGQVAKRKLPNSTVLDVPAVVNELNQGNLIAAYEHIVATYENTGIVDRKEIQILAHGLRADYLLFTRLKAEKMDIIIGRGFGASIDAMLVNANSGEVTWSGTGEWKRGGVYGFGKTNLDEAAIKLLELTFSSLVINERSTAGVNAAAPAVKKETATAPVAARAEPSSQRMTIQNIQQRLSELGYKPGPADGGMGKHTVAALKKFQHDNNLAKTGKADNATVAKLLEKDEAKAEPTSSSKRLSTESPQKSLSTKSGNLSDL